MQAVHEDPKVALTTIEDRQQTLLRWLASPRVTNSDEQKQAEDLLISARYALKEAEETRKELTRPLDDSKARIITLFRPYTDRLQAGIAALNQELGTYRNRLLALATAQQQQAMEEQALRMREAQHTGEVVDLVDALHIPDVAKTSRSNLGTVTYQDAYDIQIIDPGRVPRDLCDPSMPRIRARVKSGVTDIPGVLVTRKVINTTRVKGGNHGQQQ